MSKKAIWVAIVLVGAVGLYFAIAGRKKSDPRYRTVTVDRGAITQTVTASGTLSAVTTVQVGSQVSGIISKLHADFNSAVKKGDLLAELDPTPFQAQVEQQRAVLAKAQVDLLNDQIALTRQKRLLDEGLAAQSDYDSAKAAHDGAAALVEQAKASLAQAETNLKYTKIVSPIDGVVVARAFDVGQTVAASFQAPTLFTIAQDLTKMQVSADVSESDIGEVKVGQPVRFNVDAYPEREFRGSVSQIRLNATVNQNVVTYPVIVEVANTDLALKPTMTANVTIDVATVKDVLRVPNAALRWRPEERVASTPEEKAAKMAQKSGPGAAPAAANQQFAMTRGGGSAAGRPVAGRRTQSNIYTLSPVGEPKQVEVRTGISDGRFTQVLAGGVNVGDPVIIGLATTKADAAAAPGRPPGPGGGRRGF
jgi:HlyD family secretion protein